MCIVDEQRFSLRTVQDEEAGRVNFAPLVSNIFIIRFNDGSIVVFIDVIFDKDPIFCTLVDENGGEGRDDDNKSILSSYTDVSDDGGDGGIRGEGIVIIKMTKMLKINI